MFCDGNQQVTFDRVDLLTGAEAAEYSARHNRFGAQSAVVVNIDERLETLPVSDSADIFLYRQQPDSQDSLPAMALARCEADDVYDIPVETVLQIIIYGKSIIFLKELRFDGD